MSIFDLLSTVFLICKLLIISGIIWMLCEIVIGKLGVREVPMTRGFVHPKFERIRKVFQDNFARGWERDGAAFCLYHRGEKVVDIWGGWSDRESMRLWSKETMQIIFSSSKALAAICIAILVDRGELRYDQKIVEFWPKFGRNGKNLITVEMVLTHQAGLAILDEKISWMDASDPERMASIIENQSPAWIPGTDVGYHAFSYGWLVDQIIRRADKGGRGIGQFFREEIAVKHELDIHIGLPVTEAWRVARLTKTPLMHRIDEFITDPGNIDYGFLIKDYLTGGISTKVASNPTWMQSIFNVTLNNPDMWFLEQPAALAIGTSRDLARLGTLLISGSIISQKTLNLLNEAVVTRKDVVTGATTTRGRGVTMVPVDRKMFPAPLVGHAGFGGQNFRWDAENEISFCYMSNGLKSGLGDKARSYVRVLDALFECLEQNDTVNEVRGESARA